MDRRKNLDRMASEVSRPMSTVFLFLTHQLLIYNINIIQHVDVFTFIGKYRQFVDKLSIVVVVEN